MLYFLAGLVIGGATVPITGFVIGIFLGLAFIYVPLYTGMLQTGESKKWLK